MTEGSARRRPGDRGGRLAPRDASETVALTPEEVALLVAADGASAHVPDGWWVRLPERKEPS